MKNKKTSGDQLKLAARATTPASVFTGIPLNKYLLQRILYTKSQEIGYTDTIIDVRSNRVRSLLGLQADQVQEDT